MGIYGPFPPGTYTAGEDIAPGVYVAVDVVSAAQGPAVFDGDTSVDASGIPQGSYVSGSGLSYTVVVRNDLASIQVYCGCLVWIGVEGKWQGSVHQPANLLRVRHTYYNFGLLTWYVPTLNLSVFNGFSWYKTGHKPGIPMYIKRKSGEWTLERVLGDQGQFFALSAVGYGYPGPIPGPAYTYVTDSAGTAGGFQTGGVQASSVVTVEYPNSVVGWRDEVGFGTVDLITIRGLLADRGIPTDFSTSVRLVFWISGTHRDYDVDRDGGNSNSGIGYPAALRAIHFDSADNPVTWGNIDDSRISYAVNGKGTSTGSVATCYTYMTENGFYGHQEQQLVVVDVDLSADRYDYMLYVDSEKDTPPPGPPLFPPNPYSFQNFSSVIARVVAYSVLVETSGDFF